jgi:hypothetical protein
VDVRTRKSCGLLLFSLAALALYGGDIDVRSGALTYTYRHQPPYDASKLHRIRLKEVTGDADLVPMFTDAMVAASAQSILLQREIPPKAKPLATDVDLAVGHLGCGLEWEHTMKPSSLPAASKPRPRPAYTPKTSTAPPIYTPPVQQATEKLSPLVLACIAKLTFSDPVKKKELGSYWMRTRHTGGTLGSGLMRESSLEKLRAEIVPQLGELAALRFVNREEKVTEKFASHRGSKDVARLLQEGNLAEAKAQLEKQIESPLQDPARANLILVNRLLGDIDADSIQRTDEQLQTPVGPKGARSLTTGDRYLFYSVQKPQ